MRKVLKLRMLLAMPIAVGIGLVMVLSFTTPAPAIFGGMYEAGGARGDNIQPYLGVKGNTRAYSSMASGQQKTMAFGIGNDWPNGSRRDVEVGWWWSGKDSNAPMLYMASYEHGSCVWKTYLDWFNPGATVYCIVYAQLDSSGNTNGWWILEAWAPGAKKQYVVSHYNNAIGAWNGAIDIALFGERTSNVSNQGEFWNVGGYYPMWPGTTFNPVWHGVSMDNFSFWDSDPNYKMVQNGANSIKIVPGNG